MAGDEVVQLYVRDDYTSVVTFDRELHDRLLNDVLTRTDTPPDAGLMNAVARKRARVLLDAADEWF